MTAAKILALFVLAIAAQTAVYYAQIEFENRAKANCVTDLECELAYGHDMYGN